MTAIENGTLGVNDSDKLLTVDDLCEYLVVSKDFIYDACGRVGCGRRESRVSSDSDSSTSTPLSKRTP
jgi:hypothetical protein